MDQPSEECDGTDPGVCDDVPVPLVIACDAPSSPTPCKCCGVTQCFFELDFTSLCCGGARCQDTSGVGRVRGGACIPPICTQDADCNGYRCVAGTCCGDAGRFCGVAGCCPGSDASCTPVVWAGAPVCCRPAGGACGVLNECCSGSCTAGACD